MDKPAEIDATLRLLWRASRENPQPRRGPKQATSVDAIVDAAIAIADSEGLEACSLRRVAEAVGLRVMSLYTYIPGKTELVALMTDQAMGRAELPEFSGTIRERLSIIAWQLWEEYHAHPWLLDIDGSRPWIGPNLSWRYEWQLSAIEGVGLADVDMDQIVTLLAGFVSGAARTDIGTQAFRGSSGMSELEWWEQTAAVLEEVMTGDYPISGRVGAASSQQYQAASDPDLAFRFGLERVLDGIEHYIAEVTRQG